MKVQSSPHLWLHRPSAALWCGVSGTIVSAPLGLEQLQQAWQRLEQTFLCPACGQASTCNPKGHSPGFCSSPVTPRGPPSSKGACLPLIGFRDWSSQSVVLMAHSLGQVSTWAVSLFLWVPSQGSRSHVMIFFPSLPDYLCIFLTALVVQESFCLFPGIFPENYPTCRFFWCVCGKKWAPCSPALPSWYISRVVYL